MHMGVVRGNDNKIYNNQNMCFALTGSHPNTCVSSAMGYRYAPLEPGSILSVAIMAGLGDTSSPPSAIFIVGAIRWVTAMHREIENSIQNVCLVGTKFREENDDDARKFALIGGRCGGGYELKTQQSTKETFSYISWACVSAFLGGLVYCGSLGITSHPRLFFAYSNTG